MFKVGCKSSSGSAITSRFGKKHMYSQIPIRIQKGAKNVPSVYFKIHIPVRYFLLLVSFAKYEF